MEQNKAHRFLNRSQIRSQGSRKQWMWKWSHVRQAIMMLRVCEVYEWTTVCVASCGLQSTVRAYVCVAEEMDRLDEALRCTIKKLWPIEGKKMHALLIPPNDGIHSSRHDVRWVITRGVSQYWPYFERSACGSLICFIACMPRPVSPLYRVSSSLYLET